MQASVQYCTCIEGVSDDRARRETQSWLRASFLNITECSLLQRIYNTLHCDDRVVLERR